MQTESFVFLNIDAMIDYEWNPQKAEINFKKHGILFEEATTVFDDPFYLDFYDPDHSNDEHRYIIIGRSHTEQILLVSYTERGQIIRLISARKATRQERIIYEHR